MTPALSGVNEHRRIQEEPDAGRPRRAGTSGSARLSSPKSAGARLTGRAGTSGSARLAYSAVAAPAAKAGSSPKSAGARLTRRARRITLVGLGANVLLTAFKFVAGFLGNSQAVVADAVHSLSDMLTDLLVLWGLRYWSAPADEDHPHGHRRIETVVTGLVGLALAATAVGLGYQALVTLREQHTTAPGWIAFCAAACAIVVKEIIYRWTIAVGRRLKSSAVVANAWHHRSDALSSIPAALAVAGAAISPSWIFLDRVGAVIAAVFIVQASWKILSPALRELADRGAPKEARDRIEEIALGTKGVRLVHAIRTRYLGPGLELDLHVKVDREMSVGKGHAISEEVKKRLIAEGPDVLDVIVHIEPYEQAPQDSPGGPFRKS